MSAFFAKKSAFSAGIAVYTPITGLFSNGQSFSKNILYEGSMIIYATHR